MNVWMLFILGAVAAFTLAMGAAWAVRHAAVTVAPARQAPILRAMPLTASFGILVVSLYVFVAIFAPLIAPFSEREIVGAEYLPWSREFWLGTDNLGRDMFSRMIYGARNTVGIAFATTLLAFLIGTTLGLFAAATGGWVDAVLSRIVDVTMAIPSLILALVVLTLTGTSVLNMILIIAIIDSTRVFRITRAVSMNIVVMEYIEAARLRGEGLVRLVWREIMPNATAPLMAELGLRFCFVFLAISALSFLGLGIQPPTADWGSMVRDNAALVAFGDITPLLPAAAIGMLTIAVNFIVDWLLHLSSGLKE